MASIRKTTVSVTSVLFSFVLLGGLFSFFSEDFFVVKASYASDIPKPSVPEYTLEYVDASYDVSPICFTNSYTGENETIQEGFHAVNRSIKITIKNQQLVVNDYNLFYNISWKGHFSSSWTCYPQNGEYVGAGDSDFIVFSYGLVGNNGSSNYFLSLDIPEGGQIDFRIQAFRGTYLTVEGPISPLTARPTYEKIFSGKIGDWSEIQTLTIPATYDSPSNDEVFDETEPLVDLGKITFVIAVVALAVSLLSYFKKNKN